MTKKKITIDDLAAMTQRGFTDIKTHMATKEDIKQIYEKMATKQDLHATEGRIIETINALDTRVSSYSTKWNHRFDELHDWVEQIEDRLKSLERRFAKA